MSRLPVLDSQRPVERLDLQGVYPAPAPQLVRLPPELADLVRQDKFVQKIVASGKAVDRQGRVHAGLEEGSETIRQLARGGGEEEPEVDEPKLFVEVFVGHSKVHLEFALDFECHSPGLYAVISEMVGDFGVIIQAQPDREQGVEVLRPLQLLPGR